MPRPMSAEVYEGAYVVEMGKADDKQQSVPTNTVLAAQRRHKQGFAVAVPLQYMAHGHTGLECP